MSSELPLPPEELIGRVGYDPRDDRFAGAQDAYLGLGARGKRAVVAALPSGWSFAGKRVLDFGCGSGRVLRHFADEAHDAELWGCDIHADSVRWLQESLSPPFRFQLNGALPPLDQPDDSFDLVIALSVFTHLPDSWAQWLCELHRVLKPGGLLLATFHGEGLWRWGIAGARGVPFDPDRLGSHIEHYGIGFHGDGGPAVYFSEWWLRDRLSRGFEILALEPHGFMVEEDVSRPDGQGHVLLRAGERAPSVDELLAAGPDTKRELAAARYSLELVLAELAEERAHLEGDIKDWQRATAEVQRELLALGDRHQELVERYERAVNSSSWRLTRPLRGLGAAARRIRR
jgi:SAM-dependent methyltransferase